MAAKSQDKIVFGVALLALLASAAWVLTQQPKLKALRNAAPSAAGGAQAAYVPAGIDAPTVSTSTWPTPPAQTRGPLWIYDVFTPPEIYYNEETKEFTVTQPIIGGEKPVVKPPPPFGVELVSVKDDVFPLQLVGYVGNGGDSYQGTFENTVTGDTFLGKAGKKIPGLGLTIKSFEVKRNRVPAPDSMPIYETVATAVVVNDKTGELQTLNNKHRLIKGTPIAVLKATDDGKLFEQKEKTSFMVGDTRYSVNAVTSEPPSAEVTKEAPSLKVPETKTLTVAPPPAPPAAPAAPETASPDQPSAPPSVFPEIMTPAAGS